MSFISEAQKAVRGEGLDGWLFFNFHGHDPVSNRLLGVSGRVMNTRPWYCLVPGEGEPIKVVHAIEKHILDAVPGRTEVYFSREELIRILAPLAGRYAAQVSEHITVISTLDHGTARFLEGLGYSLTDSDSLIQKTAGVLDEEGIASHERAARLLYRCIHETWNRLRSVTTRGMDVTEAIVQGWINNYFREHGLITEHSILVASGCHSADPHYEVPSVGGIITSGNIIQFDIWAKEDVPGSIYADISWVGFLGSSIPEDARRVFRAVTGARDRAVEFISRRLEEGTAVTGAEVDDLARTFLRDAGYGRYIRHRTGHGIDTDVHGSGVNMDNLEFPDHRAIIEGSCFSIEPGLYLDSFGMRTEINAYRRGNRLTVSGGPIQQDILTL